MTKKPDRPTKLFWVDLEMTGLDTQRDIILEIAAEITDFHFSTLARYEAHVKHPPELVRARMQKNAWWDEYPKNRDDFLRDLSSGKDLQEVERELVTLLEEQFGSEPVVLAGNSIHQDRQFIRRWWPAVESKLHYRMLDVTTLKVFMQGRYGVEFEKKEVHRAFDDIQASINELQYYLAWLQSHKG